MIEVRELTKRFGATTAVDGLSFTVRPGRVTGFLGPNGSGKSTTMRMIVGLDRPDAGAATVGGRSYRAHPAPLCAAGALLEGRAVHRGRTARQHLLGLARTHGIPARRVAEVLALAGLADVADRRAGGFSLGMSQRLGVASALLGDPAVVILDEPVNGLDPDGVLWIRTLLKDLAAQGRTVLVSSHLMSETAVTADHLLVIGAGRLLADIGVDELIARAGTDRSLVRSPDADRLHTVLAGAGATITRPDADRLRAAPAGAGATITRPDTDRLRTAPAGAGVTINRPDPGPLIVEGLAVEEIGAVAAAHGLTLWELTPHRASLEQAYMDLTRGWVRFGEEAVAAS